MDKLKEQLIFEEGLKLEKYKCPNGYWTIGVGRNLDANPCFNGIRLSNKITVEDAMLILEHDILEATKDCRTKIPGFDDLNKARQDALLNMCFQMGIGNKPTAERPGKGLLGFEKMFAAIKARDWDAAYKAALSSKWARLDSPSRAKRVAWQLKNGKYYEIPG